MREFPIMVSHLKVPCPSRIPWDAISPFEGQALENHGQTLQRLSERGGLDPVEAHFVMTNRSWRGIYSSNPKMEEEAVAFIWKVVRDRTEIVAERDGLLAQNRKLLEVIDQAGQLIGTDKVKQAWDLLAVTLHESGREKCTKERDDGSPCEYFVPCPRHFRERLA